MNDSKLLNSRELIKLEQHICLACVFLKTKISPQKQRIQKFKR